MVSVWSLWMPVLLSAIFVFVASSILHMVLRYHSRDMRPVPRESEVMEALRRFDIPPGDYCMPRAGSMAAMKEPEFVAKMQAGPVALMTVLRSGPPRKGKSLLLWFLYSVVVSIFAAYLTAGGLHAGYCFECGITDREVFRLAGCTAFVGYSLALLQNSIWYGRNWGTTLRSMFDGLIYGLLTGLTFVWLWPR